MPLHSMNSLLHHGFSPMYRFDHALVCLWIAQATVWVSAAEPHKVTKEEMPRIPATGVEGALDTFRLADGFQLELFAAEPMVGDPVDACFDADGRMYVVEMHGYPFSQEPTKLNPAGGGLKDAGIVRLLEDLDGDGRADRSTVFADGISWPTSIACYDGGVFVLAPEYLYYFKDTDNDRKADIRRVVLSGFGRGNVQSVTNGLRWNLDNQIYFAAGRNPKKLLLDGQPLKFTGAGGDIRFDPRSERFESVTGGQQFGHSMDDWGTRFVCSNSNHIIQVVYPAEYLGRNPFYNPPGGVQSIAADGASARVFRISPPEPWRIVRQRWRAADKGYRLVINDSGGWEFIPMDPSKKKGVVPTEYPVGFFTSATGVTIYRGNAYPERYRGNAFIGDVGGNLVHRKTLRTDSVVYRAHRADQGKELLASKDNWFRPVNFVNAPDGSLMILDMYRETIEHPYSIPEKIKQYLDLNSGRDRGRIYRLVSPEMQRNKVQPLSKLSSRELVSQLESDNAWHRETAQRLICQRADQSIAPDLQRLLVESEQPLGRLHSIYTLSGLKQLQMEHLRIALKDPHSRVRAHAVKLSEPFLDQGLLADVIALAEDTDEHVVFQLAFSLGQSQSPSATKALARLIREHGTHPQVRAAIFSSLAGPGGSSGTTSTDLVAGRFAKSLLEDAEFMKSSHSGAVLSELAIMIGSAPGESLAMGLIAEIGESNLGLVHQQRLMSSLAAGLQRRGWTFEKLLRQAKASDSEKIKRTLGQVAELFEQARSIAGDAEASITQRAAAIQLVALAPYPWKVLELAKHLDPQGPPALQRHAAGALAGGKLTAGARVLIDRWSSLTPGLRDEVLDGLLASENTTRQVLDALKQGKISRGDVAADKKQRLLIHPNLKIRQEVEQIWAGAGAPDRAAVVSQFSEALKLDGDSKAGLKVFKEKCAACHQIGELGHKVGPELASVKNKSADDLLIAILDPNREGQPNYNTYVLQTLDGRVLNGMVVAENTSSITLQRAEGKKDVVLRENIDLLRATGVSLMPNGLEENLTVQDLADLIALIKSIDGK